MIAEEILKKNPDAVRILFNKFHSAVSFKPTIATILSAQVRGAPGQHSHSRAGMPSPPSPLSQTQPSHPSSPGRPATPPPTPRQKHGLCSR
jgi:hypothetical protein